ncbi:MAG: response regulator transcription factor [Chloroflexota bacterium]
MVDDDPNIRLALSTWLGDHGYAVDTAPTADEALASARVDPPDVVLLDLLLPDRGGLEVCRELRAHSDTPIIVLSAKEDERDKVEALDLGADDYLTKPFGMQELLARIRVCLRRSARLPPESIIEIGAVRLDRGRRIVALAGNQLHLTPTEYQVLEQLMANAGRVLTHRTLLHAVWGPGYEDAGETLRVFIAQLRRKLAAAASTASYIQTEPGVGYRFRESD